MANLDVGFLPVIDATEAVGIITDRDIVVRGVVPGRDPAKTTVGEIMTVGVEIMSEHATVEDAAHLMEEKQIRRVLVQSDDGRLVGVVSLGDIAVHSGNKELSGEALEKISEPVHSH